jgi:hypothetical protein
MANIIDSLLITMGLDGSGVSKGMDEVENRLAGGVKNITTNILAPLAGAFAFGALLNNFTSTADALGKLSKSLRSDTQDVKAWGDAVEYAGGDANSLNSTLSGLEQKLKDAKRGVGNADFRALGINAKDANGNLKTSADILKELSLVGDKMNPEKFERLTKKLGIDAGTLRLLQSGSKEVDRLVSKYKDLAYTQKDAEIAREFNNTMGDLGKTFQSASAIIMRLVVPALSFIGDKTAVFVNFLRRHESFVLIFFIALAAILSRQVIPAIYKMGAAWMANPMFWIIAAAIAIAIALAAVLEDLWSYMNGGKSALADFFAIFGTGEEISQALAETWEDLKAIGTALWQGLKAAASAFFSYFGGAVQPLINIFKNALKLIKAIFTGNFDEAIEHFMNLLASIGEYIVAVFTGAFNLVYDIVMSIFSAIGKFFTGIFDSILGTITSAIKGIVSKIPDFLLPDSIIKWAKSLDDTVKETAANMQGVNAGGGAASAADGVSPAAVGGHVSNSSETTVNVGGITVNAQSTDPAGIARETGNEVRRMTATGNKGVRQ